MRKQAGRLGAAVAAMGMVVVAAPGQALAAAGVSITPNDKGLPGLDALQTIVGSLVTVAVLAALTASRSPPCSPPYGRHGYARPPVASIRRSWVTDLDANG